MMHQQKEQMSIIGVISPPRTTELESGTEMFSIKKGGRRITVLLISYSSIQNRKVLKNKIYKKNKRSPPPKKKVEGRRNTA